MAKRNSTTTSNTQPAPTHRVEAVDAAAFEVSPDDMSPKPFAVPGAIRPAARTLQRSMIWLYGDTGVGKTTLANKFPGPWFLATEKGQDWIDTRDPTIIHSWEHFLTICGGIETQKPTRFGDGQPITHLVIDTVSILFKMCEEYVCAGMGIEDPAELTHGKAWGRLNSEFARVISKIRRWPFGLVVVSHERVREFQAKGRKTNRYEPDIGAGGFRKLASECDFIFRCYTEDIPVRAEDGTITGEIEEARMMQCHPSATAVAKCRDPNNIPAKVPMDYDALINALKGQ